jgi:hypothetical protein
MPSRHAHSQKVSATGSVFLSDPVTQTGKPFQAGSPRGKLNALRTRVILRGLTQAEETEAALPLRGEFIELIGTEKLHAAVPAETAPFHFDYSCHTSAFAAVSAYYHCDNFFRLMQSLDIDVQAYFANTSFPIQVEFYGSPTTGMALTSGNDSRNGLSGFCFGIAQSGVTIGMAADPRIILHEFGHALIWNSIGQPHFNFAHSIGDSLAAILSDPESHAPDRFLTFPFLAASNPANYGDRRHDRHDWHWGSSYDDGNYGSEQILSTTLFRLYLRAGGDAPNADTRQATARYLLRVILNALKNHASHLQRPEDLMHALIAADAAIHFFEGRQGGNLAPLIRQSFAIQGL